MFFSYSGPSSHPSSTYHRFRQEHCMFSYWLPSRLCQCNPGRHLWQEYEAASANPEHVGSGGYLQGGHISISKTLKELHWLLVRWRIDFKVATTTYKLLESNEPNCQLICDREFWSEYRGALWDHRLMTDVSTIIRLELKLALGHFAALPRPSGRHCRLAFETHHQLRCSSVNWMHIISTSF